jgi:hypothetical protein
MRLSPSPAAQFQATKTRGVRPFTGYLCLAGQDQTTTRIPELHLTRYHLAFIPRAANEPPAPPIAPLSEQEIAARAAYPTEL